MADKRSEVTTAAVADAERMYKSMHRKLKRMRVVLDELRSEGRTSIKLQYWNSGKIADKKLEVFVRGLEEAE